MPSSLTNPATGAIVGMLFVVVILALTHFVSLKVSGSVG
jgi:hypothetical protein